MTEFVCYLCGALIDDKNPERTSCWKEHSLLPVKWNAMCEKLAKRMAECFYGSLNHIEEARLWVIENVLNAGWTHDE